MLKSPSFCHPSRLSRYHAHSANRLISLAENAMSACNEMKNLCCNAKSDWRWIGRHQRHTCRTSGPSTNRDSRRPAVFVIKQSLNLPVQDRSRALCVEVVRKNRGGWPKTRHTCVTTLVFVFYAQDQRNLKRPTGKAL